MPEALKIVLGVIGVFMAIPVLMALIGLWTQFVFGLLL